MITTNQNFDMVRGDTFVFCFEVSNLENIDHIFFSCKTKQTDTSYAFQKTLEDGIYNIEGYKYGVRIAPEDTENLNVGTYYYDLEIRSNSDVYTLLNGQLTLEQDITRDVDD